MGALYIRVSDEVSDYVRACSDEADLSLAKTVEVLLDACRRRAWRVTRSGAQVKEPD